MFEELCAKEFEIDLKSHARAILSVDFPDAVSEITEVLKALDVPITEIIGSGGGETKGTRRLRDAFTSRSWRKMRFEIGKTINGEPRESTSHEVDHVRSFHNGLVALEIEWNNKDPFFDRDLENFKRLHAEGAISIGVVITRGPSLQDQMLDLVKRFTVEYNIKSFADLTALGFETTRKQQAAITKRVERKKNPLAFADAWAKSFVSSKYSTSTTHWRKLQDRVQRGVGNPCPLLLIGLPAGVVSFDRAARIEMDYGEDEGDADDPE